MSATVSASLVRYVLAATSRKGAERRAFALEAGLAQWAADGDSTRLPIAHMVRLWQVSAARLKDPQLGLRVADQWRLGACDITDYLFDTSATLGEAFSQAFRYTPLLNSAGANDVGFEGGDGQGTVRYQIRSPDPVVSTVATEFALVTLLRRARHATGHPVAPVHVGFAAAAPRGYSALAGEFGTRRIDFGMGCATMTFRRADLDLPLVRADPALAAILRGQADAELAALDAAPQWIGQFREVLAGLLDDQAALLGVAARTLAVSPRTLQRLLEREGTSWRAELDAARRQQAARLLADGVSRTGTAARLGYSDARALRRAIRRWTER
jgi:AraC-like DNA-binding protein